MAVTLRFQSTGSIPGSGQPVTMRGNSLTIGRAPENDLVLPDPDKTLSKRHCVIEDHNGNVVVVDISSNGTFLNYGKIALGTTPTPLNNGDILTIGPYEVLVDITSADEARELIPEPVLEGPVSHGLAARAPSAADLLDAPGDGGDFLDDLLGGREGPVGPRGVQRDEPYEDSLLSPLGPDDPLLPPAPADDYRGPSQEYHNPSASDHFLAPRTSAGGANLIPDDWEEDLLAPTSPPSPLRAAPPAPPPRPTPHPSTNNDPFGEDGDSRPPVRGAPSSFVPDDFDLGGDAPPEAPAATPPTPTPPAPEPAPEPSPAVAPDAGGFSDDPTDPLDDATVSPARGTEDVAAGAAGASGAGAQDTAKGAGSPGVAPATGTVQHVAAGEEAGARALLRALGAEDVPLRDEEIVPTMSRLGHVLRIVIEGLREVLMTRTSIKSEFRIQQTMIASGGNNPLKFSISAEQAVEAMVRAKAKGYLDATDAALQAVQDIKAHEVAMVSGMEAALRGVLKRLDPAELEGRIQTGSGLGGMLKSKKARYWEVYEQMYAEISDQAENEFHELFAKEFARAYQDQLDKLK